MRVSVEITRRPEIADPEGTNIMRALTDLGHRDIESVRVDRIIHLDIRGDDPDQVKLGVEEMCRQLLANPVLEDFRVEVGE
ncbi:MAG TPA: phosphoribosylformylglycinamidine synthase subunit PurS [Acidimicrobiia bacterium]|jgi:phosphoribosylformylglycinamidine synthase|nr:phosphoribosylformylglycinamidine synthase subunit PurS [Acidimicrobiia bacterium]